MASQTDARIEANFHPKQMVAFESAATEILYGGAAGGGKSFLMRLAAIVWCAAIPGLQVYLFRRIRDDLIKNHMEGPKGFRALLAGWELCGFVKIVEDEIRFWNGAKIYLCHCKDEKDRFKYQGAEIHVLLIDELTHFTDVIYRFLRNRVRMTGVQVPAKYAGRFPRVLCGANPGDIGHQFVKMAFIDGAKPMEVHKAAPSEGGMLRQFIPARVEDNPTMQDNDPGYEDRLAGLGSDSLVRAMRYGDWDIIEGAYFDNFDRARHVIRPFTIPDHWMRFRAGDWGSAKPFSFGWYAVASEDFISAPGVVIPKGAMVRYREWYGIAKDREGSFMPNVGIKLNNGLMGTGIRDRERGETISYGVLDPGCFSDNGGPSIAEQIRRGGSGSNGVHFREADNSRVDKRGAVGGWSQMRGRLDGDGDGRPMLFFFETCIHAIRTIPALQHDTSRPEDLNSDMEDHAADEVRYACMSRPWTAKTTADTAKTSSGYRSRASSAAGSIKVL